MKRLTFTFLLLVITIASYSQISRVSPKTQLQAYSLKHTIS